MNAKNGLGLGLVMTLAALPAFAGANVTEEIVVTAPHAESLVMEEIVVTAPHPDHSIIEELVAMVPTPTITFDAIAEMPELSEDSHGMENGSAL